MDNPALDGGGYRYGPRRAVFGVGAALAAGAVLALIVGSRPIDRLVATVVLLVVLGTLFAAFRMRVRLQASSSGLVVTTMAGSRVIRWADVHRVEVVDRRRLGTTSTSLEIDLDDDELIVFGRMDLGADPAEVAEVLSGLRTGRR